MENEDTKILVRLEIIDEVLDHFYKYGHCVPSAKKGLAITTKRIMGDVGKSFAQELINLLPAEEVEEYLSQFNLKGTARPVSGDGGTGAAG